MRYIISVLLALSLSVIYQTPIKHVEITSPNKPVIKQPHKPTPEQLILKEMSNEEKVGQLLIYGFD